LVKYRQDKGPFKSSDEVKKVPGIDAGKVDAAASRLVF
jgi:DNA uptake protein ComE-like DNA-binding protein